MIDFQKRRKIERKKSILEEFLLEDHVMVFIDSSKEGVDLPEQLKNNPSLSLKLSYNFQGELSLDLEAIESYLRFTTGYYRCIIPWDAVWGVRSESGREQIFGEDIPKEILNNSLKDEIISLAHKFKEKILSRAGDDPSDKSLEMNKNKENLEQKKLAKVVSLRSHLKRVK